MLTRSKRGIFKPRFPSIVGANDDGNSMGEISLRKSKRKRKRPLSWCLCSHDHDGNEEDSTKAKCNISTPRPRPPSPRPQFLEFDQYCPDLGNEWIIIDEIGSSEEEHGISEKELMLSSLGLQASSLEPQQEIMDVSEAAEAAKDFAERSRLLRAVLRSDYYINQHKDYVRKLIDKVIKIHRVGWDLITEAQSPVLTIPEHERNVIMSKWVRLVAGAHDSLHGTINNYKPHPQVVDYLAHCPEA